MRRIIIYRVAVVVALLMGVSGARAEIAGIYDASECSQIIGDKMDLFLALADLSSQPAQKYFQPSKNRFLFCMDSAQDKTKIKSQTTLSNNSQYPVIIYNLGVDSTTATPGQSLLTATGTGEIAFQNLKADGLRAPIFLQGKTTVLESSVSCDASNTSAAFVVSSDKNTFRKVAIGDCDTGVVVSGNSNNFYELVIKNAAETVEQAGKTAIDVLGKLNVFSKLIVDGYHNGVKIGANYTRIVFSTLGGDVAAVQIASGVTGVKVSQNTFTTMNTIAYEDPNEAKSHALLNAEWMGVKVLDDAAMDGKNVAKRIVGKFMDSTNASVKVEAVLRKDVGNENHTFVHFKSCDVFTVTSDDKISFVLNSGEKQITKQFLPGEKYFDCDLTTDGNGEPYKVFLTDHLRFISNTPTVSLMSGDAELGGLGHDPTIVAIAQPSMPVGSELTSEVKSDPTGDAGVQFDAPKFDPANPTDLGDNSNTSNQNNATAGAVTLGETPGGIAGVSDSGVAGFAASLTTGAGCSLAPIGASQSDAASALIWLLALLPIPILIPFRRSKL